MASPLTVMPGVERFELRARRNFRDFPLPEGSTVAHRHELRDLIRDATSILPDVFSGNFTSDYSSLPAEVRQALPLPPSATRAAMSSVPPASGLSCFSSHDGTFCLFINGPNDHLEAAVFVTPSFSRSCARRGSSSKPASSSSSSSSSVASSSSKLEFEPAVSAAAGTHVVLPGYFCPDGIGMLDINTSDGRFLFFLPWLGHTLVGTTDSKGSAVSSPAPPEEEIAWILKEASKYLSPQLRLRRSDVLSAWRGWRPLAKDPNAPPGAAVSRDHVVSTDPDTGITFVAGGKWTTYRQMAEEVVDRVVAQRDPGGSMVLPGPCVTKATKMLGADGFHDNLAVQLVQEYSIAEDVAANLAFAFGSRARDVCELSGPTGKRWPLRGVRLVDSYPYIEAEVRYAVKEYARTVEDVVCLRTRLAYLNVAAAGEAIPRVAEIMAEELGWSAEETLGQIAQAKAAVAEFGGPVPHDDKTGSGGGQQNGSFSVDTGDIQGSGTAFG